MAWPELCPQLGAAAHPGLMLPPEGGSRVTPWLSRCSLVEPGPPPGPPRFHALHTWALPVPWRQRGLSPITRCHH